MTNFTHEWLIERGFIQCEAPFDKRYTKDINNKEQVMVSIQDRLCVLFVKGSHVRTNIITLENLDIFLSFIK